MNDEEKKKRSQKKFTKKEKRSHKKITEKSSHKKFT